jgi:hypothetical protein
MEAATAALRCGGSEALNSTSGSINSGEASKVGISDESAGDGGGLTEAVTPAGTSAGGPAAPVSAGSIKAPCDSRSSSDADPDDVAGVVEGDTGVARPLAAGDAGAAIPNGSSTGRSANGSKTGRDAASIIFEPEWVTICPVRILQCPSSGT